METERRAWPDPRLSRLANEHAARRELLVARELRAVADDCGGNARVDARGDDLVGRVLSGIRVDRAVYLLGPAEASDHGAELVVVGQVGPAEHARQRLPLWRGHGRDPHETTVARWKKFVEATGHETLHSETTRHFDESKAQDLPADGVGLLEDALDRKYITGLSGISCVERVDVLFCSFSS